MDRDTPLSVINAVRAIQTMPDGDEVPNTLKHVLLVLASYWPRIWPSQSRLVRDLHVSQRSLNRYLSTLEGAGLIARTRRGYTSTAYALNLPLIRDCGKVLPPGGTGGTATGGQKVLPSGGSVSPMKSKREVQGDDDEDYIPF